MFRVTKVALGDSNVDLYGSKVALGDSKVDAMSNVPARKHLSAVKPYPSAL